MSLVRSVIKTKATVGGLSGYEFLGPENSKINEGEKITDPHATEGFLALRKGRTVFLIYAFTSARSAAQSFLSSFKSY